MLSLFFGSKKIFLLLLLFFSFVKAEIHHKEILSLRLTECFQNIEENLKSFSPSKDGFFGLILSLRTCKENLESILAFAPENNSLSREHVFFIVDRLFEKETASEIKSFFFFSKDFSSTDQFLILYSYYLKIPSVVQKLQMEEANAVSLFPAFFQEMLSQGFSAQKGFSIVEKMQFINKFFSYVEEIYVLYLKENPHPYRLDFKF